MAEEKNASAHWQRFAISLPNRCSRQRLLRDVEEPRLTAGQAELKAGYKSGVMVSMWGKFQHAVPSGLDHRSLVARTNPLAAGAQRADGRGVPEAGL